MNAEHHRVRTPEEILESALRRERNLHQFYSREVGRGQGPEIVQSLLAKLEQEEHRHVRAIEDMLLRIRLG